MMPLMTWYAAPNAPVLSETVKYEDESKLTGWMPKTFEMSVAGTFPEDLTFTAKVEMEYFVLPPQLPVRPAFSYELDEAQKVDAVAGMTGTVVAEMAEAIDAGDIAVVMTAKTRPLGAEAVGVVVVTVAEATSVVEILVHHRPGHLEVVPPDAAHHLSPLVCRGRARPYVLLK